MLVNAALMLFYSFCAIGGPLVAATFMQRLGPQSLFAFCAAIYVILILIILYRMRARGSVPADRRSRFVAMLRTSTIFARLARKSANADKPQPGD